jgi:hypothetical protein
LDRIHPPKALAPRYRNAVRGLAHGSAHTLGGRPPYFPRHRGPWTDGQGARNPLPRVKRGWPPRSMRRLPPLQGQRSRQIHRDRRTLIAKPRPSPLRARPTSPRASVLGPFTYKQDAQGAGRRASVAGRRAQRSIMTKDRGPQALNQRTSSLEPRSLGRGTPTSGQFRTLIRWK